MDSGTVLDLTPLIRAKQVRDCDHWHVEVDDKLEELVCVDCGGAVDIWWYVRRLADAPERHVERVAQREAQIAALDKELARQRETLRIQAERIRELGEIENQLRSHPVSGSDRGLVSLGTVRACLCKRCKGKLGVLPAHNP